MEKSIRPARINVRLVGNGNWAERVSAVLGGMGAQVSCDKSPSINGFSKDFHLLIFEQSADPQFDALKKVRGKWSEQDLPVIVMALDDDNEIEAMQAGANAFIDWSFHYDGQLLKKLVYGLATKNE